jgi:hypothetical protein
MRRPDPGDVAGARLSLPRMFPVRTIRGRGRGASEHKPRTARTSILATCTSVGDEPPPRVTGNKC